MEKAAQNNQKGDEDDFSKDLYGNYGYMGSFFTKHPLTKIMDLDEGLKEQTIWIRGRVSNIRGKGNLAFLIMRDNMYNVQCVVSKSDKVSKQMLKFINNITKESIIDIQALVIIPPEEILSCTQKVELQVQQVFVLSRAIANLPFQLEDAGRKVDDNDEFDCGDKEDEKVEEKEGEERKQVKVGMKTRLDNRIVDLRTPSKQGIFRINSMVCQLFREFLYKHDFTEIHSPKMLGGTSEGGSNVFRINYFKTEGCLAQSP